MPPISASALELQLTSDNSKLTNENSADWPAAICRNSRATVMFETVAPWVFILIVLIGSKPVVDFLHQRLSMANAVSSCFDGSSKKMASNAACTNSPFPSLRVPLRLASADDMSTDTECRAL